MSSLSRFRSCKNISDIALLIGYQPKKLSYILYKIPDATKYVEFEIQKSTKGVRKISAPIPELKLAQSRLAHVLQDCLMEIEKGQASGEICIISHGFKRHLSISTNGARHVDRKWVLNFDLKDFFPSINFGRVRGYFMKNKHFLLDEKAATIVAQLACHNGSLPQGAPTSPVISNLVANHLDIRLSRVATKSRCTYTRYADDITFSTNKSDFPKGVAADRNNGQPSGDWELSKKIRSEVKRSGFEVNSDKTRMLFRRSRQDVTGLVVNSKVNVKRELYKQVRAQVNKFVKDDVCFKKVKTGGVESEVAVSEAALQGMLSHIFWVKGAEYNYRRLNKPTGPEEPGFYREYRRFLDYKTFVASPQPVLLCEGVTDNIYIQCAIKRSKIARPKLQDAGSSSGLAIKLFQYPRIGSKLRIPSSVQHLNGGTGDLKELIYKYKARTTGLADRGFISPVILLVDNDQGSRDGLWGAVKTASGAKKNVDGTKRFYHVTKNLYVIPTPKLTGGKDSMIEDFLPSAVVSQVLRGKKFNPDEKTFDKKKHYGKRILAEKVSKDQASINFDSFSVILDTIEEVLDHFSALPRVQGRVML
ncbi:retron Ec67 family RNA-directed DNA polymerase/endonuclease [Thalassococcus lentus]|uniref:RNA-directed DNA polymerase n=1 Tax=Thalassococcus lentus TaxID=1210524 RepID=A0ABT4XSU8_9RHOB|nr:retron Ec67 family RNA-directed DNA polymerase/endonuclease [Thalassococcus lentus]MDA7425005.1 retron Ec67 family RNA-directed DNA polymerase/endonuclease [Thalassococcus lentus]